MYKKPGKFMNFEGKTSDDIARIFRWGKYCDSYIYFIESNGLIKIGKARRPLDRLSEIYAMSATPIKLLLILEGGRVFESHAHAHFQEYHHHGEWFIAGDGLLEFIANSLSNYAEWMAAGKVTGITHYGLPVGMLNTRRPLIGIELPEAQ